MGKLKNLFSDSIIYGLSSIVGRFLNYLLVPLYTYKIAADSGGYGVVTNLYAYTALLLVLLTFGMETTFFRFANKDGVDSEKAYSTSLLFVGGLSALFVLLCSLFLHPIAVTLGYAAHPEYIEVMAVIVALDAFQAIMFADLRRRQRAWKFALLKLAFIFCNIGLNLFVFLWAPALAQSHPALMAWYDPSYQVGYIFWINLVCTAAINFGFIPELKRIRRGIDFQLLKQMLRYAFPLLLLGLVGILNQVADKICFRFIVPGQEGEVQLGIYGACVKIAMIMAVITQAFRFAYEPLVFGGQKDKNNKEFQALATKYFVMFTLLAFLCVVFYIDVLKYIVKADYWEALRAVPIVMLAEIFMGIYFNLSFWYKLTDETWWGALFSGIGCALLLAVNFIFVPVYGYMACAWGGFIGYGTCMLLSFFVGQRKYYVPYPVWTILGYFALALGLYAVSVYFRPDSQKWIFVLNTGLLMVYLAVIAISERAVLNRAFSALKIKYLHRKSSEGK